MWVITMFDPTTDTPKARKEYARFRKDLLNDDFTIENARVHPAGMGSRVPSAGEVRFLTITDEQFGQIGAYVGRTRSAPPNPPAQLEFF